MQLVCDSNMWSQNLKPTCTLQEHVIRLPDSWPIDILVSLTGSFVPSFGSRTAIDVDKVIVWALLTGAGLVG